MISAPAGRATAWDPLRHPAFRLVWMTFLGVQLANWSETVGAVAVISAQSGSAALLALVQTASTLPAVAVALPAGAAADLVDRRSLLVALVASMCASMLLLTAAVATDTATPAVVLALTFAMGCAIAVAIPAFASLIPDLVPPDELAAAVTLNGISINLARALGPALAGIVLALTTASALFGLIAGALGAMALLLLATPRAAGTPPDQSGEGWTAAMRAGVRFARSSTDLQAVLGRGFAFVVPASALWAVLPAVAVHRLDLEPAAFGGVLAALGSGAVFGAQVLPWLRARLGLDWLVSLGTAYGAANLVLLSVVESTAIAVASLVVAGAAWIAVLSSLNTAAQLAAPAWVRGRALSINQLVFAAGMAAGSAAWGLIAEAAGLESALIAAGGVLVASLAAARRWPLARLN
ncbi:MAG TPA: MFS transporter [Solirubrobacteraceae bacterium]|nr:MFS transporter [Solirubrobacteraceae bacterium]